MKDPITQAANGNPIVTRDLQAMQDEYDELGQQMSDITRKNCSYFHYGGLPNLFGVSGKFKIPVLGLARSAAQTFRVKETF